MTAINKEIDDNEAGILERQRSTGMRKQRV
jgi:hypothetical protein